MRKIIIADTSCLTVLEKIGHLDLLNKVFGEVVNTQQVFEEFGKSLPFWFSVAKSINHIPTVKPILEKIKSTNFRISPQLEEMILAKCEEKI